MTNRSGKKGRARAAVPAWTLCMENSERRECYRFDLYATPRPGEFENWRGRPVTARDVAEFIFLLLNRPGSA